MDTYFGKFVLLNWILTLVCMSFKVSTYFGWLRWVFTLGGLSG